jgi:hypothetical protein
VGVVKEPRTEMLILSSSGGCGGSSFYCRLGVCKMGFVNPFGHHLNRASEIEI